MATAAAWFRYAWRWKLGSTCFASEEIGSEKRCTHILLTPDVIRYKTRYERGTDLLGEAVKFRQEGLIFVLFVAA